MRSSFLIWMIMFVLFALSSCGKSSGNDLAGGTIETTNGKITAQVPIEQLAAARLYLYSFPDMVLLDSTEIDENGEFDFKTIDYDNKHFLVQGLVNDSIVIWAQFDHLDDVNINASNGFDLKININDESYLPDSLFIFRTPYFAVKNENTYLFENLPDLGVKIIVSHDEMGEDRIVSQFIKTADSMELEISQLYDGYMFRNFNFPYEIFDVYEVGYWWSQTFPQFSDGLHGANIDSYGARVYDDSIGLDNYIWRVVLDDTLDVDGRYSIGIDIQPRMFKEITPWLYEEDNIPIADAVDLTNLDSVSFMAKGNCDVEFRFQNNTTEFASHYMFESSTINETTWTKLSINMVDDTPTKFWNNTSWTEMKSEVQSIILEFNYGCEVSLDDVVLYGVNLDDMGIINP